MVDVSRRGFLGQAALATGVGVAGGLGLHKLLAPADAATPSTAAAMPSISLDDVSLAGPMVLHVRDLGSGEISMMIGTQELIYRDPELVSRLVQTAAHAGQKGG